MLDIFKPQQSSVMLLEYLIYGESKLYTYNTLHFIGREKLKYNVTITITWSFNLVSGKLLHFFPKPEILIN